MAIQSLKGQKHPKQIPCTLENAWTNFCPPMIKQSYSLIYIIYVPITKMDDLQNEQKCVFNV
jgi:hypothetical protein